MYILFPTLILLSGVGRTYFSSCYDKGNYYYDRLPAWRQLTLKLDWVLMIANVAKSKATEENGLELINFGYQSITFANVAQLL
jgi:hypothetical protein